jgi:branched-chain amino acid transport system ATP-binding protein
MLEARALDKSFGSLRVARDVNLGVAAGARTLFNLLTGEIKADGGTVMLDGIDMTRRSPDARARAGLARSFQKNNLFRDLSVRENLALAIAVASRIGGVFWRGFGRFEDVHREAEALAERVNVADDLDVAVRHLSYGTQRQVEVGLALALKPKVLLLDEPTSGMSPEETASMQALIAGLPPDLTVVVIEHDMDVVFGLAERITVLDYGSVLLEGTPEEVRASDLVRQRYLGDGAT